MNVNEVNLLDLQFDIMKYTKLDAQTGMQLAKSMHGIKPGTEFLDFTLRDLQKLIPEAKQRSTMMDSMI